MFLNEYACDKNKHFLNLTLKKQSQPFKNITRSQQSPPQQFKMVWLNR